MSADPAMHLELRLELDLEARPIEGTLHRPDRPSRPFIGWLGMTAALADLCKPAEPEAPR